MVIKWVLFATFTIGTLLVGYLEWKSADNKKPSTSLIVSAAESSKEDILACSALYSVEFTTDGKSKIIGDLALHRFPLSTDVAIQFINLSNNEKSPPAIISTRNNIYFDINISRNAELVSRSSLIQLYTQMQWSTDTHQISEKDANGWLTVSYDKSGLIKKKHGYRNPSQKVSIEGEAVLVKSNTHCFNDGIKGMDTYRIKHPVNGKDYSYDTKYSYQLSSKSLVDLPNWMAMSKSEAEYFVTSYAASLPSGSEKKGVKYKTISDLNDLFKKNNHADIKASILKALENEEFIDDFISRMLNAPDELNSDLAADIIMYMSHADTELSQNAILTLLENASMLPINHALQAAITLGEFSDIKISSYPDVVLQTFGDYQVNEVVRSASVSSLGRMAKKLLHTNSDLASGITSSLLSKLSLVTNEDSDSAYLLDALSNTRSSDPEVLKISRDFLASNNDAIYKRAVTTYVNSGERDYISALLTDTSDFNRQSTIIMALSEEADVKQEKPIGEYILSQNENVRLAALQYISKLDSIDKDTLKKVISLDRWESDQKNRKEILMVLSKNIHLLD